MYAERTSHANVQIERMQGEYNSLCSLEHSCPVVLPVLFLELSHSVLIMTVVYLTRMSPFSRLQLQNTANNLGSKESRRPVNDK